MQITTEIMGRAVEEHFSTLQQRVQKRLDGEGSLDWLLDGQDRIQYQPDYLTMASVGKTRGQQIWNTITAQIFPRLWYKIFWPRISGDLTSYIEESYLQKIFREINDAQLVTEIKGHISAALSSLLATDWQGLRHCTFTEISNCLVPIIHEPLKPLLVEQDIFLSDKRNQNAVCLDLFRQIKDTVRNSENRLEMMTYLCCRSNWIDSLEDDVGGLLEQFVGDITRSKSNHNSGTEIPSDTDFFQFDRFNEIVETTNGPILYESDNCGEIVFDLCLIEEFISRGRKVYLCLKKVPMVNDAMEKDVLELLESDLFLVAKEAYQNGGLKLIIAGAFPGGGKLVHEINDGYRKAYIDSVLVIVKGQGNFQSMPMGILKRGRFVPYHYNNPIVFMTAIKADMMQMCLTTLFPNNSRPPKNSLLLLVNEGKLSGT